MYMKCMNFLAIPKIHTHVVLFLIFSEIIVIHSFFNIFDSWLHHNMTLLLRIKHKDKDLNRHAIFLSGHAFTFMLQFS